ncbi:hypothetical protein [Pseudomonas alkylphenolica]|uniref:hypothetical protein n=1 Tax=Pseudomonas alkylphenolica TaxID=237609 RepID=UPI0018D9FCE6|nr:hypothetical protein [Pseudomonas alkylphenolica]MBH3428873.1 hypothetical protein [Pseudomonas alkylphenolica]
MEKAAFCLSDEEAQNHFHSVGEDSWIWSLVKNPFLNPPATNTSDRVEPIATLCEHVMLAQWARNRRSPRAFSLVQKLPRPERIRLAAMNVRELVNKFRERQYSQATRPYAVLLGLCAPGPSIGNHASPALALELFYLTLKQIFDGHHLWVQSLLENHMSQSHPASSEDLDTLLSVLPVVIANYLEYVKLAFTQRSLKDPSAKIPSLYAIEFCDFIVERLLVPFISARVDVLASCVEANLVLELFFEYCEPQAKQIVFLSQQTLKELVIRYFSTPFQGAD